MKQPEYTEGPEALENFKRGMIAPFKVPKGAISKARKKGRKLTAPRRGGHFNVESMTRVVLEHDTK